LLKPVAATQQGAARRLNVKTGAIALISQHRGVLRQGHGALKA